MPATMSKSRRRGAQLLAVLSATAGLVIFATSGVSTAAVAPVVDYSTYPPTLPASCTATGGSTLVGLTFSDGTTTATNLGELPLVAGQSFAMTWTGFAPGCEGVGVGLSSKAALVPTFQESADYWLYEFDYCGPEAGTQPCGPGPYSLSLRVPPAVAAPCYQLDAHVGPPLGQVGPTTDYYGFLNGQRDLLISAQNGGIEPCGPLPPCVSDPSLPAVAFLCLQQSTTTTPSPSTSTSTPVTTTTTTAPVTTTTGPPPVSTSSPAVSITPPSPTVVTSPAQPPCAAGEVRNATTGACVSTAVGGQLPITGRDSASLASTGALLLFSGLCIGYAYRRSVPSPSVR